MDRERIQRRKWIKVYPMECLEGSIRYQLEPDERGVWYDLMNFAAICSNDGAITDRDKRPYPHGYIANRLNIPLELLDRTLKKCIADKRISEDKSGIHITHWKLYQSEYDRTKGYQQAYRERQKVYGTGTRDILTDDMVDIQGIGAGRANRE